MSNSSITLTYEQTMQSIREAQQETYKVIQDFVKNTDQAIQRVSERHEKTEKALEELSIQHKETEKTINRVSERHEKTEKALEYLSVQHKETEKTINRVSERHEETEKQYKETEKQRKETEKQRKETEKDIKEMRQSTKELHESTKEMQQALKNLSKQMGTLGNRFGELAEHMVFPAVVARFNELGYHFRKEFEGNFKVINQNNQIIAEIDAYLENGTTIAVIEIKAKPDKEDIKDHIQRIVKLKQNRQELNEPPKIIIGAIAGAIFPEKIKTVAIKAGLYVLVQSGDTMKLEIPKGFKPKEF
jgi:hypothetical protein